MPPIGQVPKQMYAQVIRADRFGEPKHAFKVEKIAVPEIRADEVLVYVMAAGVNFNNVWAALGSPVDVIGARQKVQVRSFGFSYRRQRRVGNRLCDRARRAQRQGRRPRRDSLRRLGSQFARGPQRRRSDVRSVVQNLGLRNQLGQLRTVRPRAGASVHAQGNASDVGRSRRADAGGRDCVPDADGMVAARRAPRRRGVDLGRIGRARMHGDSDRQGRRRNPGGHRRRRSQNRFLHEARRQADASTGKNICTGA